MSDEAAKRYNVHFRTAGFMVLDYEATPEMGNIYPDEKHGYQMVIADITQREARRVSKFLNEKEEQLHELEKELQEYKDNVADFLFENMSLFNEDLINQINNELGIDLMDILELYNNE